MKSPEIDRAEWDFQSLTEPYVLECLEYEIDRERQATDPSLLNFAKEVLRTLEENDHDEPKVWMRFGFELWHMRIAYYLPYFPSTPYLNLPIALRKEQLQRRPQLLRPGCVALSDKSALQHLESRDHSYRKGYSVASFEIYWDMTDEELKRQFGEWLLEQRPTSEPGKPLPPDVKTARANLRCLGALRLLRKMDAAEAQALTEIETGKPLFSGSAWSRAKAKAERLIEQPSWLGFTFPKSSQK
jgi:hypothetical protein